MSALAFRDDDHWNAQDNARAVLAEAAEKQREADYAIWRRNKLCDGAFCVRMVSALCDDDDMSQRVDEYIRGEFDATEVGL